MEKVILLLIIVIFISCTPDKKTEKEIKYYNVDYDVDFDKMNYKNFGVFKLFPNGDTNFVYLVKNSKIIYYVAWDTNGKKTFENKVGTIKIYDKNVLRDETISNGNVEDYTQKLYYKSGNLRVYQKVQNLQPVEYIKFNEKGDTIYFQKGDSVYIDKPSNAFY